MLLTGFTNKHVLQTRFIKISVPISLSSKYCLFYKTAHSILLGMSTIIRLITLPLYFLILFLVVNTVVFEELTL